VWEATNLSRNVVVEVTCIPRVLQLRMVWCRVSVNVLPVNAPKPRVHLVVRHSVELLSSLCVQTCLDHVSSVDALGLPHRRNKATPPRLYQKGVGPGYRRGGLGAQPVFWLA
jgi:hypothetical protein